MLIPIPWNSLKGMDKGVEELNENVLVGSCASIGAWNETQGTFAREDSSRIHRIYIIKRRIVSNEVK